VSPSDALAAKWQAMVAQASEDWLKSVPNGKQIRVSYEDLLAHCERMSDRVAILDPPQDLGEIDALTRVAVAKQAARKGAPAPDQDTGTGPAQTPGLRPRQSDFGAFYVPWLVVRDPLTGEPVGTPPSGHMAGVWARTDTTRGVHKAPANEPVRGVVDLSYRITRGEQEVLNPAGVNCIRYFPAEGVRVWGARTLADQARMCETALPCQTSRPCRIPLVCRTPEPWTSPTNKTSRMISRLATP